MAVLIEAEQAFFFNERLKFALIRRNQLDLDLVVLAHLLDKPVGLGVQPAGVEAEDFDVLVQLPGHVHQHHIFGAAEGNPELVAKMFKGEFENVLGGLAGVCRGEFGDVERMAHQAASYSEWRLALSSAAMLAKTAGYRVCSVSSSTLTLVIDSWYSSCQCESATIPPPPQQLTCPSLISRLRIAMELSISPRTSRYMSEPQ